MKLLLLCLLFSLTPGLRVYAAPPASQTDEINWLLTFIEQSDAVFLRNGKEYTAKEGADHLRGKLAKAGDRVKTTEEFITGIASKSYLSGSPYMVKIGHEKPQPTGAWLAEALARYRDKTKNAHGQ